jgi:NADH:ubiquinone oxidoreductase subunit K
MLFKLLIISFLTICLINLFLLGGRNFIILLLTLEGFFFGLALLFLTHHFDNFSTLSNHDAMFAGISIVIVAAAESAVGLALVAAIYRETKSIMIKKS